jgi:hypothetical protein
MTSTHASPEAAAWAAHGKQARIVWPDASERPEPAPACDHRCTCGHDQQDHSARYCGRCADPCNSSGHYPDDCDARTTADNPAASNNETPAICELPHLTIDEEDDCQRRRVTGGDTELQQARETNRRLNLRCQETESALATIKRSVGEWELTERSTYVPLRTIAAIGKSVGRDITNARWLLHYQRVETAEAAITRIRQLADRWENALTPDRRYAEALRAALDGPADTTPPATP